jgi:hypothetical protein
MRDGSDKKTPEGVSCGDLSGARVGGLESLSSRLQRYHKGKSRAREMMDFLLSRTEGGADHLALRLASCGSWLLFRHYYTIDKLKLHKGSFCQIPLLCPLCAIRRGAKLLARYVSHFEAIVDSRPDLKLYSITLTVKNGFDFQERLEHLLSAKKKLHKRFKNYKQKGDSRSMWAKIEGLVGSLEFTFNPAFGWHPHIHILALSSADLATSDLRKEWSALTRDSDQVHVEPARHAENPVEDFLEVFKYSLKFSSLPLDLNFEAYKNLRGRRLLFTMGLFRGVQVSQGCLDDKEGFEGLPYLELFLKHFEGLGYVLLGPGVPDLELDGKKTGSVEKKA